MRNAYFDLTRQFNSEGTIAVLSSGQAVVWYRLSIMSKDGDWILRETEPACQKVLAVLGQRDARYRSGAPLDIRWLQGGWSSHFEFVDEQRRRVRCDFVTRPPRIPPRAVKALFGREWSGETLPVVDLPSLLATKQTQRAKDYAVIGALARLLPPAEEILWTTDPDRVLELAGIHGAGVDREPVRRALAGAPRAEVVAALALEADAMQQQDRDRMVRYARAARRYLEEFHRQGIPDLDLAEGHARAVALAATMLPFSPGP